MTPRVLVAIPVYNHGASLRRVVEEALAQHCQVLVVDDGSSDGGAESLAGLPVRLLRHAKNRGKGAAILSAAGEARRLGMSHLLTLDADGQHDPADIPAFLAAVARFPQEIILGRRDFTVPHVPLYSRFGRGFSAFWMRVQTGAKVADMQSGFRAYPLEVLESLLLWERRYTFEVEVLVKAVWAGYKIREIPIGVCYPPAGERVSHFKLLRDNVRFTVLNTRLTIRALIPVPFLPHALYAQHRLSPWRPLEALRYLLAEDATPAGLAKSVAMAVFITTIPVIGLQSILLLLFIGWLGLNRLAALLASVLTFPPLVPALCLEAGYWLRHGTWLTEASWRTLGHEAQYRLLEWLLGSLLLAPLLALASGAAVFGLAMALQKGLERVSR